MLSLGNISKYSIINHMKKKRIRWKYIFFPVGFNLIDTNDIDIRKCLIKG